MMTATQVFRVEADVDDYQTLVLADDRLWQSDLLRFGGEPKTDWVPPEVFVLNPLKKKGHFFHFAAGAIAFARGALDVVDDLLEMAGQVLPLSSQEGEFFVLNVTECVAALDPNRSRWRTAPSGQRLGLVEYAFRSAFSESSLFKIPETRFAEILTYNGLKAPEDEFRSRYTARGLEGLRFTLIGQVPRDGGLAPIA